MANTWTAYAAGVTFSASAKTALQLFNGAASGQVLRVYRAGIINTTATTTVTGAAQPIYILKTTTAWAAGTAITPVAHDSSNSALSTVTCTTGSTVGTITNIPQFNRFIFSTDEVASGGTRIENLYCLPSLGVFHDTGYGDTNIEPITLRANEGIVIYLQAGTAVGTADFWVEFTSAAT